LSILKKKARGRIRWNNLSDLAQPDVIACQVSDYGEHQAQIGREQVDEHKVGRKRKQKTRQSCTRSTARELPKSTILNSNQAVHYGLRKPHPDNHTVTLRNSLLSSSLESLPAVLSHRATPKGIHNNTQVDAQ
jgi:hypothetical protein